MWSCDTDTNIEGEGVGAGEDLREDDYGDGDGDTYGEMTRGEQRRTDDMQELIDNEIDVDR